MDKVQPIFADTSSALANQPLSNHALTMSSVFVMLIVAAAFLLLLWGLRQLIDTVPAHFEHKPVKHRAQLSGPQNSMHIPMYVAVPDEPRSTGSHRPPN